MDVIKSSRFWLALTALLFIGALAILGKLSADTAAGYLMAIIAGFGVGKAGGGAVKALVPLLLLASLTACGSIRWVPRGATVAPPATQPAAARGEWSVDQCRSQQTKATLLLALSAVFASSGSVGGVVSAAIHDEKTASIVTGAISAAFALGTVITVPLLATARSNLGHFCVEYQLATLRRELAAARTP